MTLPTKAELDALDMQPVYNCFNPVPEREYLLAPAGVEHYRLLKWIGDNCENQEILEIGHYMGLGSMCLAHSGKNFVRTVDTTFTKSHIVECPKNMTRKLVSNDRQIPAISVLYAHTIIFIDAWHLGALERHIFNMLRDAAWHGILIYDDIDLNQPMHDFWASVVPNRYLKKLDATAIGHHTGTGIIEFI